MYMFRCNRVVLTLILVVSCLLAIESHIAHNFGSGLSSKSNLISQQGRKISIDYNSEKTGLKSKFLRLKGGYKKKDKRGKNSKGISDLNVDEKVKVFLIHIIFKSNNLNKCILILRLLEKTM